MNTTNEPLTFPFVGWRIGAEHDASCVDGKSGDRSEWQLGVATYARPSEGSEDYNWHETDVAAFSQSVGSRYSGDLGEAIWSKNYTAVERILSDGVPVSSVRGALSLAFRQRWDLDKLHILFDAKADPNDMDAAGESGMSSAVFFVDDDKFPEVLKLLLRNGGNVNLVGTFEKTPLHEIASSPNKKRTWDALIAAGANPNIKDGEGKTALDLRRYKRQ